MAAKNKTKPTYQMKVISVGSDTITIQTGRNAGFKQTVNGEEQPPSNVETYQVTTTTTFSINDLKGTIGDIEPGMVAQVTVGSDRKTISGIVAHTYIPPLPKPVEKKDANKKIKGNKTGPAFEKISLAKVVDIGNEVITIGIPDSNASSYYIKPFTIVKLNGNKSDLSVIEVGMPVKITASAQSTAGTIDVYDIKLEEKEEIDDKKKK